MVPNEFYIGGKSFTVNKLNAIQQYHVVRRMGPILSDLIPVIVKLSKEKTENNSDAQLEQVAEFATPIMNGLSKLSDKDAEFVLFSLLSCVQIKDSDHWFYVSKDGMLMYKNLELPILLQLAGHAFMFNLSGFFDSLPQK